MWSNVERLFGEGCGSDLREFGDTDEWPCDSPLASERDVLPRASPQLQSPPCTPGSTSLSSRLGGPARLTVKMIDWLDLTVPDRLKQVEWMIVGEKGRRP